MAFLLPLICPMPPASSHIHDLFIFVIVTHICVYVYIYVHINKHTDETSNCLLLFIYIYMYFLRADYAILGNQLWASFPKQTDSPYLSSHCLSLFILARGPARFLHPHWDIISQFLLLHVIFQFFKNCR